MQLCANHAFEKTLALWIWVVRMFLLCKLLINQADDFYYVNVTFFTFLQSDRNFGSFLFHSFIGLFRNCIIFWRAIDQNIGSNGITEPFVEQLPKQMKQNYFHHQMHQLHLIWRFGVRTKITTIGKQTTNIASTKKNKSRDSQINSDLLHWNDIDGGLRTLRHWMRVAVQT